jgi:hypothetical protein
MENSEYPPKRRAVPKFGPLYYWTIIGAIAGFVYGSVATLLLLSEGGGGSWFANIVYFSCISAFIGLIVGFIKDLKH